MTPDALAQAKEAASLCLAKHPDILPEDICLECVATALTEQARASAKDTLSELSAVEYDDARVAYVTVQVSRAWREELRARAQEETPPDMAPVDSRGDGTGDAGAGVAPRPAPA